MVGKKTNSRPLATRRVDLSRVGRNKGISGAILLLQGVGAILLQAVGLQAAVGRLPNFFGRWRLITHRSLAMHADRILESARLVF